MVKPSVWNFKPCPYCQGNKISIDRSKTGQVRVLCLDCMSTSMWVDWIPDAIRNFYGDEVDVYN